MTTNFLTRFEQAATFYRKNRSAILDEGRDEWGVDPYAWEEFNTMSPIENDIWHHIRSIDAVLYPQFPIGWYFADFCNPVAGVVIECDGAKWHQDVERDARRQEFIEREGYTVYRITGSQCKDNEYAKNFVLDIAARHCIIRDSRNYCVLWSYSENKYVVMSMTDAKNVNAACALAGQPGLAVVRDRLYPVDAYRIAKAFNPTVKQREE